METLTACILNWAAAEARSSPGGYAILLTFVRPRHARYLQVSAVYFDPVSTAVAYKRAANNDTGNVARV